MSHRVGKLAACDLDIANGLAFDLFSIKMQRHGHRAKIFRLCQSIKRPGAACICQLISHLIGAIGVQGAGCFDKALAACHVEQFLRHGRR